MKTSYTLVAALAVVTLTACGADGDYEACVEFRDAYDDVLQLEARDAPVDEGRRAFGTMEDRLSEVTNEVRDEELLQDLVEVRRGARHVSQNRGEMVDIWDYLELLEDLDLRCEMEFDAEVP